ncbi:hypothetical protein K439DRAFT_1387139 [Ramaria rubella]|nr:hypothetical protein K439DRAFT_1387139 [Ramaria rubella]
MPSDNDCILFEHFVKLLNSISQTHPRSSDSPRKLTNNPRNLDLVGQWFARVRQYDPIPPHTCKIFFRLFFPEEDVRRRYNIKETILAKTLAINVFGLSIGEYGTGRELVEWSDYPDAVDKARLGCLGVEVEKALAKRHSRRQGPSPGIQKIDNLLDELASLSGYSNLGSHHLRSQRSRVTILRDLYLNLEPLESKFITQIILKDLRPVLYPLTDTHTTRALLHYKTNALHVLTKWEVMRAWHASMPRIYRARATFDEAASAVEMLLPTHQISQEYDVFSPLLGVPIEIPKSQKGVKLSHTLNFLSGSEEVWAETKYDGERMQIHIDLSRPSHQQIMIFSKSKRNSSQDRMGTHPIIRAALGLPSYTEDYLQYPGLREHASSSRRTVASSVILDAEMVSYSESKGDIDEFWRIRSLVEGTAHGIRSARHSSRHKACADDPESQESHEPEGNQSPECIVESLQSNGSDNGDRHLMIVFFDIMFLNGGSLLGKGYNERRALLERTINVVPGYVTLTRRQRINLSRGIHPALRDLALVFAEHVANHQEGLVLKASSSTYNDNRYPWVKLKRDYIPGYGDTIDLVIVGASWNKARARELRVAPETFTTFYIAALDATERPSSGSDLVYRSPRFQVLFTVEYGMDRDQLEAFNLYIKTSEPQPFSDLMLNLPYQFVLQGGFAKPAVMFSQPLLGELFGAGFSKDPGAKYYNLRFPRLTKVWRLSERNWTEGICLTDFQKIARTSIGRESREEWATRNVDAMWGEDNNSAPKDPQRIADTMQQWYEKLLKLEGLTPGNTGVGPDFNNDIPGPSSMKRRVCSESKDGEEPSPKRRKLQSIPIVAPPLRPLGSMTNFSYKKQTNTVRRPNETAAKSLTQSILPVTSPTRLQTHSQAVNKAKCKKQAEDNVLIVNRSLTSERSEAPSSSTMIVSSSCAPTPNISFDSSFNDSGVHFRTPATSIGAKQGNGLEQLSPSSNFQIFKASMLAARPISSIEAFSPETMSNKAVAQSPDSYWPHNYCDAAIVQFIQDAYVWIYRDKDNKRPPNRPPALHLIPQNRRIGVIYFLLIICGCRVEVGGSVYLKKPEQFQHVNKCVMFVKTGDQPEIKRGLDWLLHALESWRTELNKPGNKELFVFDFEMITYSSLATFRGDVASQAIWRSSRQLQAD